MSIIDRIPANLNPVQRQMAEEVIDKANGDVTILPSNEASVIPGVDEMVPIYHTVCKHIAFFYTHKPNKFEFLTATRARNLDGSRPDRGQPIECGSCGCRVHDMKELRCH